MSIGTTRATKNGYSMRGIENICKLCNFFFRLADDRLRLLERYERSVRNSFLQCNISRKNNNCHSTERNCSSYCNLKDAWNLLTMRNQLTVLTALIEQ